MRGHLEVLIVDDEAEIRDLLRFILEAEGYQVAEVTNGTDAVLRLKEQPLALVLLDLHMPVMDGRNVLTELRTQGITVPVIILTAGVGAVQELRQLGAAAYLDKPFEVDQLLALVARHARPAT
jgi:CheY-like chemotaxis protein